MRRIAQGEEEALRELMVRHQGLVWSTVYRMLPDREVAADLTQEVFVRLWRSAGRYEPSAKFTTYLLTIAKRLVFNEVRRRRGGVMRSLEEMEEERGWEVEGGVERAPDEELVGRERQRRIEAAIAGLPKAQRWALVLCRYEGLSYEEIAEVMGISLSAVKSHLFRARQLLREELRDLLEER